MKIIIITLMTITSCIALNADWSIETIHEPPADYKHYYNYKYKRGSDAIHFIGDTPGRVYAYRLDLNTVKVTDSIMLLANFDEGSIKPKYFTLSDNHLYLEKFEQEGIHKVLRWSVNDYSTIEDIAKDIQDTMSALGRQDGTYNLRGSIKVYGKDYRVFKVLNSNSDDLFYTNNDLTLATNIVFGESQLDIENRTVGKPITINDSLVFTSTISSTKVNVSSWAIVKQSASSSYYNKVLIEKQDEYELLHPSYLVTERYIYTIFPYSQLHLTRVVKYDAVNGIELGFHDYGDSYSTISQNGKYNYLLSLFDGRVYDPEVSTETPVIEIDTTVIHPREVEKLAEGDYLVFSPEGIFRFRENSSVQDESPQITPSAIYDLTGRAVYIGEDAESKLRTLTRGTYIIMVDGKGELRRVE